MQLQLKISSKLPLLDQIARCNGHFPKDQSPAASRMVRIDTLSSTNRRVTQTNNTLKAAAARTGVTVKITPHDMRRRTAQEAAALNKATGIDSAAQVLGHRPIPTMTGFTQKYVGDMRAVDWERRTTLKDDLDWSLQTDGKRQKIAHRQGIFTPSSKVGGTEQAVVKLESNADNSLEAVTSNTNAKFNDIRKSQSVRKDANVMVPD